MTELEFTNISELFKKKEYKDTLMQMKELVKVAEIVDRPLVITDYKEDTMPDQYKGGEKPCFRMDFYFIEDEETREHHYIRTEAKYLWDYLKTVEKVSPGLLSSCTVVTTILKGEKKVGGKVTPYYYFAGTQ